MWICENCGWEWPIGHPYPGAECDNCGGELIEDIE